MPEERTRGTESTARVIKKMTLPDGSRVGIVNLDDILSNVFEMKLVDHNIIKTELLKKAEVQNYIPAGAKPDYSAALLQEYQRKFGASEAVKDAGKIGTHKHTRG